MDLILLFKSLVMGVVEGATEFLPISSTGHLIIVGDWLDFLAKDKRDVFEIVIQLASILAVCWEFRKKLLTTVHELASQRFSSPFGDAQSNAQRFIVNLFLAFLPAAVLGLLFHHQIKQYLFSPLTVALALIVGGVAILWIESRPSGSGQHNVTKNLDQMTRKQALQIGLAQSLALFPGVSRAGATILGGMMFGLNRQTATEFSFFLAIPIMFAATAFDLLKSWRLLAVEDVAIFVAGFITAFLSALLVIRILIRFVATHNFKVFAWYRILFGTVVLLYFSA